jgi:hypothetical protein
MARHMALIAPDGKVLFNLKNHYIDAVTSHTIVFSQDLFTKYRILDKLISLNICFEQVTLYYKSGCVLLVKP